MLGIAAPFPTPTVLREAGQATRLHVPCSPQGEGQPQTQGEQDGDLTPEALWGPWGEEDGKEDIDRESNRSGPTPRLWPGLLRGWKERQGDRAVLSR